MSTDIDKIVDLLEAMAKAVVRRPGDVEITQSTDEIGVLLILKVNPSDAGLVIGKQGSMALAMRTIVSAMGAKYKARVSLKLDVPQAQNRPRPMMPNPMPDPLRENRGDDIPW